MPARCWHPSTVAEPTILIKDPSIGVLAPLWHRALTEAGYRATYVVTIRDPIEVARSLEARGDMTVPEGLALWAAYMKRIAEFSDSVEGVVYVRYTDLLDDWRGVVGRVSNRLGLALDVEARAAEVDRFLERRLHRQRSDEGALAALPDEPAAFEVRALYRAALARCAADAEIPQGSIATAHRRIEMVERASPARMATATFVLCIENNAIRDQALLLCESIRQFGGNYRDSPIMAFSPRAGLAVDGETRRVLAGMGVEYVDEPINATCHEYGPANRVFAGAWAEKRASTDFVVVLDSDTVYLQEPEMPAGDVAVRPVDAKGSATRGPGDVFEDYWVALAQMCGTTIDRLPYLRGNDRRTAYPRVLQRRPDRLPPRQGNIHARGRTVREVARGRHATVPRQRHRHLRVDRVRSERRAASSGVRARPCLRSRSGPPPTASCITPRATTCRCISSQSAGEIGAEWCARPPVHVHYHYMFTPQRYEVAMEIMAKLGVPADRLAWLAERIPFSDSAQSRQVA